MVEHDLAKVETRVRFSYAAQKKENVILTVRRMGIGRGGGRETRFIVRKKKRGNNLEFTKIVRNLGFNEQTN